MVNRRTFLRHTGLLASTALLPFYWTRAAAGTPAGAPPGRPDRVILDYRHPAAAALAGEAFHAGIPIHPIDGDLTALWRAVLEPHWRAGGGAVAGCISAASFFCLEEMAKQHWHPVSHRIEHRRADDGGHVHRVVSSGPCLEGLAAAVSQPSDWQRPLARMLARHHLPRGGNSRSIGCNVGEPSRDGRPREYWVSFVIPA